MTRQHLFLQHPENWSNDERGKFFEDFVADVLRPMRLAISERLRVTGMEIDLLAKGIDQPRTILVECKAQRDALPADTISKLLGNVTIRGADAGRLFSCSDLSKDEPRAMGRDPGPTASGIEIHVVSSRAADLDPD